MTLTQQDMSNLVQALFGYLIYGLFIVGMNFIVSTKIGISFESGLLLTVAVMSVGCMLYLLRSLLFAYVELIACVSATLFLMGAHDASAELYVRYFTLLGIGDLPQAYNWIYASLEVLCIGLGAFYVKRDLL